MTILQFVIGPINSNKSTWFYQNFPYQWGDHVHWLWKPASVRSTWKEWWTQNQTYWKRRCNHPDAFWNPNITIPEVWMVRIRRPEWFWGHSCINTDKIDSILISEYTKMVELLMSQTPQNIQRLLCWVIDDTSWKRFSFIQTKVWICPIQKNQEYQKITRYGGIQERICSSITTWNPSQWNEWGWNLPSFYSVQKESILLPTKLVWQTNLQQLFK